MPCGCPIDSNYPPLESCNARGMNKKFTEGKTYDVHKEAKPPNPKIRHQWWPQWPTVPSGRNFMRIEGVAQKIGETNDSLTMGVSNKEGIPLPHMDSSDKNNELHETRHSDLFGLFEKLHHCC
ncbi:hypothetical protein Tco_0771186 [Tanacetum coccineum]|uniref:Uncharacterized protein n=1 Tax=Tanacetum coccineum TaxID=301880 RepID=A0ABQ4ZF90_9ASTR